jgi:oxygen-independent coproporphyrinogen-3 oxidase
MRITTRNLKSPERWLDSVQQVGHGLEEETVLDVAERAEEKLLMGLRLCEEGALFDRFQADEKAYLDALWRDGRVQQFCGMGLLEATDETLRATAQGQLVLNKVIEELLN